MIKTWSKYHKLIFSEPIQNIYFDIKDINMDHGECGSAGSGGSSVLKIVGDLAKGSKMPTVRILKFEDDVVFPSFI